MLLGMMGLGLGILISGVTTKYRDLQMLVGFGVHLWMYISPVTYSSSLIAEKHAEWMGLYMLNPITPVVELFRSAYLGVPNYSANYIWVSVVMTVFVFALGVVLFSHTEKNFMDKV